MKYLERDSETNEKLNVTFDPVHYFEKQRDSEDKDTAMRDVYDQDDKESSSPDDNDCNDHVQKNAENISIIGQFASVKKKRGDHLG